MTTKVTVSITAYKLVEIDLNEVYRKDGIKLTTKKAIKDYAWDKFGPAWGASEVTIEEIKKVDDEKPKIKKGKGSY